MIKAKSGNNVRVHYKGTLNDGTVFDDSKQREQTLDFELGSSQIISGFSSAVIGMNVGDTKAFKVPCNEAYGEHNPAAIISVPRASFPAGFSPVVGEYVIGGNPQGQPIRAKICSYDDSEVTLDHNHELADQDLNFEVELVEIL